MAQKTSKKNPKRCSTCGGDGGRCIMKNMSNGEGGMYRVQVWETCKKCNGSGYKK